MNRYIIPCTEEQTKKALELGAPITILPNYIEYRIFPLVECEDGNERPYIFPTAEQMLGWLEEQGILIEFSRLFGLYAYRLMEIHGSGEKNLHLQNQNYQSYKEAILAAIDVALDYLIKNKK